MRTPQEIADLVAAAEAWRGTPFSDRGCRRGAGVTCHHLPAAILRDARWLPELQIPEGETAWAAVHGRGVMEEWFDGPGRQWFAPADPGAREPGDVLGFRLGRCIHHLGVELPGGAIIHAIQRHGVVIAPCLPPQWAKRLQKAWRPISQH